MGSGARGAKWVTLEQMDTGAVTFHHWQGLTLVHFSAQPEPFLTQNSP